MYGLSYDDKPPRWTEGEEDEQRREERIKRISLSDLSL
jgi:hypothetical protein